MWPSRPRWPRLVLAAAAVSYLAITTPRLAVYPIVGGDEPWIAAAPAKLAAEGVLGNDLFTGYYGMERHHLQHLPVYPLLEAGIFKAFGVGVWQMRVLSIVFGLLLLVAVFAVGNQVADHRAAALALVLLLLLRATSGDGATGILLLDRARINRYDIAVPVFGLAAWWMLNAAGRRHSLSGHAAAGALAGLSTLSHLYGVFWLAVLGVLVAIRERRGQAMQRAAFAVAGGFAAVVAPWAVFIAAHWSSYLGQMRPAASRFDLLAPSFYAHNVISADGPLSIGWAVRSLAALPWHRVGTWSLVAGLALGAVGTVAALRGRRLTATTAALPLATAVQLALFTTLLSVKTPSYLIALWPLGALALATVAVVMWDRAARTGRLVLGLLLALIAWEGASRIVHASRESRRVSPYAFYTGQIAGCLPPGSRVLGLQHYWIGLREFDYRTWLLPIYLSREGWYHEPLTVDEALRRVDPSVVLIDRHIAALLDEGAAAGAPNHEISAGVARFLADRQARLVCVVRDPSYGTMHVYQLLTPAG